MNLIAEWIDWLQSLPADYAFLLALPFAVGAAGLAAEWFRRRGQSMERPDRPAVRAGGLQPQVPGAPQASFTAPWTASTPANPARPPFEGRR